ncbi:glucan endo-1,3-beta-glucosidase-like [Impatiens glandulifera]|uniref:glucan endo-1,3-beta-glucosidase-like n=1 Tax=Impatiens glandulifera TaxID=253017 RepID=UPI001FB0EA5F|nr:glucan endo-1,3-beta-glucosidase-like [Impatiens glandulifera]
MPGRRFETYIFGLFNENLKPGSAAERNFGLFRPDMTPVYNIGLMRGGGNNGGNALPAPSGNQWCVAKPGASDAGLGSALNWACGQPGINCSPVNTGGPCFEPNTVSAHASYVMNAYYKAKGSQPHNCDFSGTAMITHTNPSHGTCHY